MTMFITLSGEVTSYLRTDKSTLALKDGRLAELNY